MTLKITDDVFLDQAGRPRRIRGVTVNSASPLLVSLAAQVGFEAVWIESEHGPVGFERAETLCLAAEAGGIFPAHSPARWRAPPRAASTRNRGADHSRPHGR